MLNAIFRLISLVFLALTLVAAVLDVSRSIADSRLRVTPLIDDWNRFTPDSLEATQKLFAEYLPAAAWDPVFLTLISAPSWAIFAILSILFAMAARRRRRWNGRFAN